MLGGGLPLGSLCEITEPEGSGHCSLAFSLLANSSAEGACAYIDVSDMLSPKSAAAAGITLANLLWVRFAAGMPTQMPALGSLTGFSPSMVESRDHKPIHGGCGSSHPRGETKGLAPVLEEILFLKEERRRRKMEGTPGHPNQPLGLHTASQDQVDWERWNLRKADETDPLRQKDRQAAEAARQKAALSVGPPSRSGSHGTASRVRFAPLTKCCSRAASGLSSSILLPWLPSKPCVSLQRPGSASAARLRRATPSCSCSPIPGGAHTASAQSSRSSDSEPAPEN